MTRYVSLGSSCCMTYQIEKYNKSEPTLFFDWLMCINFNDVVKVVSNLNTITRIVNDKYTISILKTPSNYKYLYVKYNRLQNTTSYHDLPRNYRKKDIKDFLSKSQIRLKRLHKLIKDNDQLFFMRVSEYNVQQKRKDEFHEAINHINKNCNYKLFSITYGKNLEDSFTHQGKDVLITLRDDKNKTNWRLDHLNWQFVFDTAKSLEN